MADRPAGGCRGAASADRGVWPATQRWMGRLRNGQRVQAPGIPAEETVRGNADRTLRDLDACEITTYMLIDAWLAGVMAARSSGIFCLGGRRIWVQHSNYVYVLHSPVASNTGIMVEHGIFADASCRERLGQDIQRLTETVYQSLLRSVRAIGNTSTS